MMKNLLNQWDINCTSINEVQENVWNIDNAYFLKVIDNEEWLKNLQLYEELREMGVPSPEVLRTINGENYLYHNNYHYFLTRKLKGRHLNKEEVINDPELARLVGQVIAKLHKAFYAITDKYKFYDNSFVDELNSWIKSNIEKYATNSFANYIFKDCVKELNLVYSNLERHLIHRDMHLGNLLFDDNEITGYIDFDLTQVNARIFDIAYFLVGWIVGEINSDKYMEKWKHAVQAVIKGYQEEQELNETEINSIGTMMCCIEMLFVAYFSFNDLDNTSKADECLRWLWNNRKEI